MEGEYVVNIRMVSLMAGLKILKLRGPKLQGPLYRMSLDMYFVLVCLIPNPVPLTWYLPPARSSSSSQTPRKPRRKGRRQMLRRRRKRRRKKLYENRTGRTPRSVQATTPSTNQSYHQ